MHSVLVLCAMPLPYLMIAPFNFRLVKSHQIYEVAFFAIYSVPSAFLNTIAVFGTESQKRLVSIFCFRLYCLCKITAFHIDFLRH